MPRWRGIVVVPIAWTLAAELVGPMAFVQATGDTWDVLAYGSGALAAELTWRRHVA